MDHHWKNLELQITDVEYFHVRVRSAETIAVFSNHEEVDFLKVQDLIINDTSFKKS